MNLTVKSRHGLKLLKQVHDGYYTAGVKSNWEITKENEENIPIEMNVGLDIEKISEPEQEHKIKLIALEVFRIKQMQYLKRYIPKLDDLEKLKKSTKESSNSEVVKQLELIEMALSSIESHYYVNLIGILITDSILQGRENIDLVAFARFNLKDYNEDFDNKIKELKEIKDEIESGFLEMGNPLLSGIGEDFVGNPFEAMKALSTMFVFDADNKERKNTDITIIGKKDGSFDVLDGTQVISKESLEEITGYAFEIIDDETDYDFKFENSMIAVIYSLIFLNTKVIYIEDKFNNNIKNEISTYLEQAGAYPEYAPYLIDKK